MEIVDIGAHFHYFAHEFGPDGEEDLNGCACLGIPTLNMNADPADAGAEDEDENVVDADGGFGNIFEPQPFFGTSFDQSLHEDSRIARRWRREPDSGGRLLWPLV